MRHDYTLPDANLVIQGHKDYYYLLSEIQYLFPFSLWVLFLEHLSLVI